MATNDLNLIIFQAADTERRLEEEIQKNAKTYQRIADLEEKANAALRDAEQEAAAAMRTVESEKQAVQKEREALHDERAALSARGRELSAAIEADREELRRSGNTSICTVCLIIRGFIDSVGFWRFLPQSC